MPLHAADVVLTVHRAHTFDPYQFRFLDAPSAEEGTPIDLTNYAFRLKCEIKSTHEMIFDLKTADGGITMDAAAGRVYFGMDWGTTKLLPVTKNAPFELQMITPAGAHYPAVKGVINILDEPIDD